MTSSAAAKNYFAKSDYYASCPGDWIGRGAEMLGLVGSDNPMHFYSLADNLDPNTGKQLTTYSKDGRRVGMDLTFNSTKSVGIARELAGPENAGDPRIEVAHREAVKYAMGFVENDVQARVRVGRADYDRTTGNLVAYRVTHRDTRINADDQRPDMSLHDHVFVFNATYDDVEDKWKACQMGQIKHDAPFFEAIYHNRLASNLRELGYGVRRDGKAFEINGVTRETIEKFSRRREYIKAVAAKLGITRPESMSKLGATTRLGKAKELVEDLNAYFVGRLANHEREQLSQLEFQPSYESSDTEAVKYAIDHIFERKSVVEERKLYETALRHGIGSVTPEGIQEEAKRQGLIVKGKESSTRGVLAEEGRIIDFAREGRGTMRPLNARQSGQVQPSASLKLGGNEGQSISESTRSAPRTEGTGHVVSYLDTLSPEPQAALKSSKNEHVDQTYSNSTSKSTRSPEQKELTGIAQVKNRSSVYLSPEQQAMVSHVLKSTDRVILVIGDAGTGKTRSLKTAFESIHCPSEILAPSAAASRGVLRDEGFAEADTVASFLGSKERHAVVKNGVIWVDEAGLLPIKDLSSLTDIAKQQNARLVLQGDPKQHSSPARNGDMMNILQEYAGLPVGRLTEIWRQKHEGYKRVVADIAAGGIVEGFDGLNHLGWVKKPDELVKDYLEAIDSKKAGQTITDRVMVIAPTHAEGEGITDAIRKQLKEREIVSTDEQVFTRLRPVSWTDAQKADLQNYTGNEVLCFHRSSGTFKAGERIGVADWPPGGRAGKPSCYSVYTREEIPLAVGDSIRITARGKTKDGKHVLDNGSQYTVSAITPAGDIALNNEWVISKDFGHLSHGYVSTSHASQGRTVDRVLIAMGSQSLPAIGAEQFYVSVSRGRQQAKIYSDLPAEELRSVIQRTDSRKSATEVFKPKRKPKVKKLIEHVRKVYAYLKERTVDVIRVKQPEKEQYYAR